MLKEYTTVSRPSQTEIIIKKSRFISQLYPCDSIAQSQELLAAVRKKYWDARHSCSAVICGMSAEYMKCSDDGEPQGTAGVPMLEALKMSGLTNVLCVVTRYFGGILLGAGGLVRAYSGAVTAAVAEAELVTYAPRETFLCEFSFKQWARAQKTLESAGFTIADTEFGATVTATLGIMPGEGEKLSQIVSELTAGAQEPLFTGEEYVKIIDKR